MAGHTGAAVGLYVVDVAALGTDTSDRTWHSTN